MNRMGEFEQYRAELEQCPPSLESAVRRGTARAKHTRRARRAALLPLGGIAVLFLTFLLLVNLSPTAAYAMGRVPLLGDLARAVAVSPSLKAAVDNKYVQPIGQSQTQNGVTVTVDYVIADQKEINVFYTVSEPGLRFDMDTGDPSLQMSFYGGPPSDGLYWACIDSAYGGIPEEVPLRLSACRTLFNPTAPEQYGRSDDFAVFDFDLRIDPNLIQPPTVYTLNAPFELAGQKFVARSVEVYPLSIRAVIWADPNNAYEVQGIRITPVDRQGEEIDGISRGLLSYFSPGSVTIYVFSSNYFSREPLAALRIGGTDNKVQLRDKANPPVRVDLESGTADWLPPGVSLQSSVRDTQTGGWTVSFVVPRALSQMFPFAFDEKGGDIVNGLSSHSFDLGNGSQLEVVRIAGAYAYLKTALFYPTSTDVVTLDQPVEIPIG